MRQSECLNCDAAFEVRGSTQKFCSAKCQGKAWQRAHPELKRQYLRKWRERNRDVELQRRRESRNLNREQYRADKRAYRQRTRARTNELQQAFRDLVDPKEPLTMPCITCGEVFTQVLRRSSQHNPRRRYCSKACRDRMGHALRDKEAHRKLGKAWRDRNKGYMSHKNRTNYYADHEASKARIREGHARMRATRQANPAADKQFKTDARFGRLRRMYKLTREQHDTLLAKQKDRCAICATDTALEGTAFPLYVDHCHKSGRVRGLLCNRCNRGLGDFRDDPELLAKAIGYLKAAS